MKIWTPILVPALVAGVFLIASWRVWRRRDLSPHGHWGGAAAFAGAYFSTHVVLLGWPVMPPAASAEWQAWLAIALGMAGIAQRWWGGRSYIAWPVRVAISAAVCFALFQGPLENDWGRREGQLWLAGLTAALMMMWYSFELLAAIRPGASLPLSLWAYCSASAGVFFLAGSGALGQLAGALAAAAGAATVLAWWARGLGLSGGALTAFAPLYAGLLLRSYFFGELSPWSAGLLYLAPFALWYGERRSFLFTRPWKAALVRVGLIAAPSLVALGVEWWISSRSGDGGY